MRLTVGGRKGGIARTTTAIYLSLAEYARSGKRVLLVDIDSQNGTSFEWHEDAGDEWPKDVVVEYWPHRGLSKRVDAAMEQGQFTSVIIDTGNDAEQLKSALEATEHLLIPMAPSKNDVTRLSPTLEAAADVASRKPLKLSMLLTQVRFGTISARETRAALNELVKEMNDPSVHVLDIEVPEREKFRSAFGTLPNDLSPYDAVLAELHLIEEGKK